MKLSCTQKCAIFGPPYTVQQLDMTNAENYGARPLESSRSKHSAT